MVVVAFCNDYGWQAVYDFVCLSLGIPLLIYGESVQHTFEIKKEHPPFKPFGYHRIFERKECVTSKG